MAKGPGDRLSAEPGNARGRGCQPAQPIANDRATLGALLGLIAGFALRFFRLQKTDQIDGVGTADALGVMDHGATACDGRNGFSGAGSANQDQVGAVCRQ